MRRFEKIILTDCDGVLLNWEQGFHHWMIRHGYEMKGDWDLTYDIAEKYGLDDKTKKHLVKMFNENADIGYLAPLRDAVTYVRRIHEQLGYTFIVITSLTKSQNAQDLRIWNLQKLFGNTTFSKFHFLDTGQDKDDVLSMPIYKDSGYFWVEDKWQNAECGEKYGLNPCLIAHGHNEHVTNFPRYENWREIYEALK